MQADIISLRITRALCLGGATAFLILTVYGVWIGLETVWTVLLAGIAAITTWLVFDITRILRIVEEVQDRQLPRRLP